MPDVWINGEFVDEENATVNLRDTGLLHAAGVFTTLRAQNGHLFRLDRHLDRLRKSCEDLFIPLQFDDAALAEAAAGVLHRNDLREARMRITATRGMARQDPLHGLRLEPTVFITAAAVEPYPAEFYQRGMTVIVVDEQKLNPYDIQAGHKTLNYFSRLAALRSASQRGSGEALWFNVHNFLQSGSISNVFLVKDQTLLTPPTPADLQDEAIAAATGYPRSAVLPGVTRAAVIELAAASDIPVKIKGLTINDLLEADEAFITNSIMQIMPVCRIERRALGEDRPGAMTKMLMARFADLVLEE